MVWKCNLEAKVLRTKSHGIWKRYFGKRYYNINKMPKTSEPIFCVNQNLSCQKGKSGNEFCQLIIETQIIEEYKQLKCKTVRSLNISTQTYKIPNI